MGSPPTHVRAATLADILVCMRSNAKLSAGLKRSRLRGGHVPPVPGSPLSLDPLVVMAVIRNKTSDRSASVLMYYVYWQIFRDLAC